MLSEKTVITKSYVSFGECVWQLLQNCNALVLSCHPDQIIEHRVECLWRLGFCNREAPVATGSADERAAASRQMSFFDNMQIYHLSGRASVIVPWGLREARARVTI